MQSADEIERQIDAILASTDPAQLSKLLRDAQGLWFRLDGPQRMAMESEADVVLYGGAAGGGKALAADTPIVTPFGLRAIGTLRVGDTICAADGTPTKVIGVYPQGVRPMLRVTFQDGVSVLADAEHRWNYGIARKQWRKSKRTWKVGTTAQLQQIMTAGQRVLIPLCKPLKFTKTYKYDMRPVDPYVLGLLLGDGYTAQNGPGAKWSFATMDHELLDALPGDWVYDSGCSYRLRGPWRKVLMQAFDKLGLKGCKSDTKFIPPSYLWGTVEQRWSVLQGLMDTDGTVHEGKAYFCSVSPALAEGVAWLVRSLGGRATITEKTTAGQLAYNVYVRLPDNKQAFRLQRKRDLVLKVTAPKRRIVSIETAEPGEAVCIAVDHSDALYVAGEGCVVTHNTDLALGMALTLHRRTLFIRREATQLQPAYDRLTEVLGHREGFNSQTGIWRLPDGRQAQFGGVQNPGDETKFQGNPRDLLVLDEAANLLESQARFLMGWVRSVIPGQRCRTLMCSNPPTTAEGEWLISYFGPWLQKNHPHPAVPGEIRWFATIAGKDVEVPDGRAFLPLKGGDRDYDFMQRPHNKLDVVQPQSRTFIPSKISDNPFLMETGYKATLQALPEPLRSQMLHGDFLAGREDGAWQVFPTSWVEAAQERWKPRVHKGIMKSMGADVSRGGRDESVIVPLYEKTMLVNPQDQPQNQRQYIDLWFDMPIRKPGHAVLSGPALGVDILLHRTDAAPVHVDAIGPGVSVIDYLVGQDVQVVPVTGSEKSIVRDRTGVFKFKNLRAQIIWQLREMLDPANRDYFVQLPPDDKLKADLCALTFKVLEGNVIQVISKDDLFKVIQRSTDTGDATVYASMRTEKRAVMQLREAEQEYQDAGSDEDGGY